MLIKKSGTQNLSENEHRLPLRNSNFFFFFGRVLQDCSGAVLLSSQRNASLPQRCHHGPGTRRLWGPLLWGRALGSQSLPGCPPPCQHLCICFPHEVNLSTPVQICCDCCTLGLMTARDASSCNFNHLLLNGQCSDTAKACCLNNTMEESDTGELAFTLLIPGAVFHQHILQLKLFQSAFFSQSLGWNSRRSTSQLILQLTAQVWLFLSF